MLIINYFRFILTTPFHVQPKSGMLSFLLLLPTWGKVGKGVETLNTENLFMIADTHKLLNK